MPSGTSCSTGTTGPTFFIIINILFFNRNTKILLQNLISVGSYVSDEDKKFQLEFLIGD